MSADTYNDHPARLPPEKLGSYRPQFLLINWTTGSLVGNGSEAECRKQLDKITNSSAVARVDSFIIAETKALSELKRIEI